MLRDESFFFLRGGGLETGLYFGASIVFHAITGFSVYNFFGGYWLALKKKFKHSTWIVESTCSIFPSPWFSLHDFFSAVFAKHELFLENSSIPLPQNNNNNNGQSLRCWETGASLYWVTKDKNIRAIVLRSLHSTFTDRLISPFLLRINKILLADVRDYELDHSLLVDVYLFRLTYNACWTIFENEKGQPSRGAFYMKRGSIIIQRKAEFSFIFTLRPRVTEMLLWLSANVSRNYQFIK